MTDKKITTTPRLASNNKVLDVIIIGAGQAGLSTGFFLQKEGLDFVILEKNQRIGDNWRSRWDSLKLFSPSGYNNLPEKPFPDTASKFPAKDEVADYLENYAKYFDLPVLTGASASCMKKDASNFMVDTSKGSFRANRVVIATGAYQTPWVPPFSQHSSPALYQIHTSQYKNPGDLPPGDVLVVGTGASGVQIAHELGHSRNVYLSGRYMTSYPRSILGKDIYWWFYKTRLISLSLDSFLGRRMHERDFKRGDKLVGTSMETILKKARIKHVPRVKNIDDEVVILENGQSLSVKCIIWATGYRNDYPWVKLDAFDNTGKPVHKRGVSLKVEGLYFIGLRWLYRVNSPLLGGVGRDAKYLAVKIIEYQQAVSNDHR